MFWDAGSTERPDEDIWSALQTLPQRQRAVLVLRYYLGAPDDDIANLLDCREGSVRSLAARAFKALRPLLRSPDGLMGHI
jgi:RNA polymerase sigma factor (sigma-70 family)